MFIRQNSTSKILISPVVSISDGYTMVTTLDISTADSAKAYLGGDNTVVDIAAYTWAASTIDGAYELTLQTGISDTPGELRIIIEDVSLCLPIDQRFYVIEEDIFDAYYTSGSAGMQAQTTLTPPAATTKPSASPTLQEAMSNLHWALIYGKVTWDSTTMTVYRDDGATECFTAALSDAGGVVTRAEAAAGT